MSLVFGQEQERGEGRGVTTPLNSNIPLFCFSHVSSFHCSVFHLFIWSVPVFPCASTGTGSLCAHCEAALSLPPKVSQTNSNKHLFGARPSPVASNIRTATSPPQANWSIVWKPRSTLFHHTSIRHRERTSENAAVGRQAIAHVVSCDTAENSPLTSSLLFLQSSETSYPIDATV